MNFKWIGQDAIPTGLTKQIQSVQGLPTVANSGALSNTPMWYDYNDLNSTTARVAVGSTWWDQQTGNAFKYVKAGAALTPGMLLTFQPPTTGTITSSGSTVYDLITNIDLTTLGQQAGNYLWTLNAVGTYSAAATPFSQSLRLIKSSTLLTNAHIVVSQRGSIYGSNQYDPDPMPSVPANGSACCIIRPFNVIASTTTSAPIGVCLAEVTSGNYTVMQVAGLAMIQATNGTAATVVGSPGASLAAGVFTGGALAITGAGQILPLTAHNSATGTLIPAYVNFLGA